MGCKGKKKKMFLGGIDPVSLGTSAISGAISIYNAAKAKQDAENVERNNIELAKQDKLETDKSFLENYNSSGVSKSFYRTGGIAKLNTRKGLLPLSQDGTMFEVIGPKHTNGGVDLGDIEVEGGEVIKKEGNNLKVLSDAESVLGYSPADNAKVTGNFEEEFNKQENIKDMKGLSGNKKKAELGLNSTLKYPNKFKSLTGDYKPLQLRADAQFSPNSKVLPTSNSIIKSPVNKQGMNPDLPNMLIDNAINLGLTALTPKVPKPILQDNIRLQTDINTNPLLDEVANQQQGVNRAVDRNISDANVAMAIKQSNANSALGERNKIKANEINAENQLINQERGINAQVSANNKAILRDNSLMGTQRNSAINSSLSANAANLAGDLTTLRNNKNIETFDNKRLMTTLLRDTYGNLANSIMVTNEFDDIIRNSYDQLINSPYMDAKLRDAIIRKKSTLN